MIRHIWACTMITDTALQKAHVGHCTNVSERQSVPLRSLLPQQPKRLLMSMALSATRIQAATGPALHLHFVTLPYHLRHQAACAAVPSCTLSLVCRSIAAVPTTPVRSCCAAMHALSHRTLRALAMRTC